MLKVQVTSGGVKKQFSFAKEEKIVIGRSADCPIAIDDKKSSRHHCAIERTGQGYRITDMNSVNGTFINGVRLPQAPLAAGDEIKIGDVSIKVVSIDLAARAPAVSETARNRVKNKIDEKRSLNRQIKTYEVVNDVKSTISYYKMVFFLVGGVAAILLVLFFLPGLNTQSEKPAEKNTPKDYSALLQRRTDEEQEAARLLESIDNEILSSKEISQEHIDRCRDITRRIGALLTKVLDDIRSQNVPAKEINAKAEMLHNLYGEAANNKCTEASDRYYSAISKKQENAETEAAAFLKKGDYGGALKSLRAFKDAVDDPTAQNEAANLIDSVHKEAAKDFAIIMGHFDRMLKDKRYAAAKKYLVDEQKRFRGTEHDATIFSNATACDQYAAADKPLPPSKEEVAIKEMAVKEKSLKPLIDQATSLLNSGRPLEAETAFKKLLNEAKDNPQLAAQYKDKYEELRRYNTLARKLIDEINAGKLAKTSIKVTTSIEGAPAKATDAGITFATAGRETSAPWKEIPPKAVIEMMSALGPKEEELYTLAVYCEINKLLPQAYETIYQYMRDDKTGERRQKGEQFVARTKNAVVPAGGYLYVPSKKDFVSRREKKESDTLAEMQKTIPAMAKMSSASTFEKSFEKAFAAYTDGELSSDTRQKIREMLIAAVKQNKVEQLDQLKKKAGSVGKLSQLRDLKIRLNKAKSEALAIIFDRSIYPDADHGRVGQPKVDAAVAKVEEIWKESGKLIVKSSPELMDSITTIRNINSDYLKRLGETPSVDDLKDMEDVINNIGGEINLSTYALDAKERETITYNQMVEKYNAKLGGVSDLIKEHVRIVNDYRDMMGLKKLFIDKLLDNAAQKHTENMQAAGNIWHVGSDGDPGSRAKAAGFSGYTGENVLMGSTAAGQAFKQWYNSSGHHRNMLGKHTTIGVGVAGRYWTQMFGVTKTPW